MNSSRECTKIPLGMTLWVRWACIKTQGCEEDVLQSPRNRDDRNPLVESKGVYREIESEGSRRQIFGVTNRNLI